MPVRNPTAWSPPSRTGTYSYTGGVGLTTLSGDGITTLAGDGFVTDTLVYNPEAPTAWALSSKNTTGWQEATVVTVGNEQLTDNLGNLLQDNLGNNIVTNPTYNTPKTPSAWTISGV